MLDIRLIRSQPEQVQAHLNLRGGGQDIGKIVEVDREIRLLETKRSHLQVESNAICKQVGQMRRNASLGESASSGQEQEIQTLKERANQIEQEIAV
ncbi:hypothetical protein V2H45_18070 [Tumidithrix elongata RA019]|uniref:Serine-tRNA synthetase type1 N-terminal domain-containing protein n=1 Tax=Tumidithrix elongata BACA0141 TaxID=2716417 RepID=A0AAW9Q054_9CYAN|nr:hypothetical protein [Tumidithrix elongata RA019]